MRIEVINYWGDKGNFLFFLYPSIEIGYDSDSTQIVFNILFWSLTISFQKL